MPAEPFAAAMRHILSLAPTPRTIVLALSGGMDSVVLLHLLAAWRENLPPGARVVAAHLNHRLRGSDADADQEFCRDLAARLSVDFAERRADVAEIAKAEGVGVEEAGRLTRYRFFHSLAGEDALILTGHHADDQAETILMHLRRGAHRRGLSGMRMHSLLPVPPDIRVRVGRPLLAAERQLLRRYAEVHDLQWREDSTNDDPSFARNRIRHRVIPMLESILPGFRRRLLQRAAVLAGEEEELSEAGRELAERCGRREGGGRVFLLSEPARADPERLIYALRHVVEEELGARLPYGAALSRLSELAVSGRLGETLSLPSRLRVRKEPDGLFFFFPDNARDDRDAEFILPDPPFEVRAHGLTIRADWRTGLPSAADREDPEVEWLDPAGVRWPLRLRAPRPGERFRPLGAPGSRKIQDILVDLKTPRRTRGLPRALADHAGVLWLWPLRLGHRVRLIGPGGRALRMEMRE